MACEAEPPASGSGLDLLRRQPDPGSEDWWSWSGNRARLGGGFNEEGSEGLLDRKAPGKLPILNDAQSPAAFILQLGVALQDQAGVVAAMAA